MTNECRPRGGYEINQVDILDGLLPHSINNTERGNQYGSPAYTHTAYYARKKTDYYIYQEIHAPAPLKNHTNSRGGHTYAKHFVQNRRLYLI